MYHSITFFESMDLEPEYAKNSWDDWHIISPKRLLFNPPPLKTHYIDIPGADGQIDLTEALVGRPVFGNRTGTFDFLVMNGYGNWADRYSAMLEFFHGKRLAAVLEDDPGYYYNGRFTVESWDSESSWSKISIGYNVEPYKYPIEDDPNSGSDEEPGDESEGGSEGESDNETQEEPAPPRL